MRWGRGDAFAQLQVCLGLFADLIQAQWWSDVSAEQQVALLELYKALVRARDVAGCVALAFKKGESS